MNTLRPHNQTALRNTSVGSASSGGDTVASSRTTGSFPSPYPPSRSLDTESPTFSSARFLPINSSSSSSSSSNDIPTSEIKLANRTSPIPTTVTAKEKSQNRNQKSLKLHPSPPRRSISGQRCNLLEFTSTTSSKSKANKRSWTWVVTKDIVSPLPAHHPPLLPTTSTRLDNVRVETISRRISDFMRVNSILCCHHCSDMGRITCKTTTCLKFTVQLWVIDDDADDSSDDCNNNRTRAVHKQEDGDKSSIIVEVERRDGCPIEMQRIRRGLVRCCTGSSPPVLAPSTTPRRCQMTSTIVKRLYEEAFHDEEEGRSQDFPPQVKKPSCEGMVMEHDLELCMDLLESSQLDQNLLGMEGLCILTDPSKACLKKAEWVARLLVFGQGLHGKRLREAYGCFLPNEEEDIDRSRSPLTVNDPSSQLPSKCRSNTQTTTLLVLRNSLELVLSQQESSGNSRVEQIYLAAQRKRKQFDSSKSHSLTMASLPGKAGHFWTIVTKGLDHYILNAQACPIQAALAHRCWTLLETHCLTNSEVENESVC